MLAVFFANALGAPAITTVTWGTTNSNAVVDVVYTLDASCTGTCTYSCRATDASTGGNFIDETTTTAKAGAANTLTFANGISRGLNTNFIVTSIGTGGGASAVTVSLGPLLQPSAPSLSTPADVGSTAVSLSLTVASNGGSPLKHFSILQTPPGTTVTDSVNGADPYVHSATGLTKGVSYFFIVKAVNNVDTESSTVTLGPYIPADLPAAPYVMLGVGRAASIEASISYNGRDDGGRPLLSYELELLDAAQSVVVQTLTGLSLTENTTITGLTNGEKYYLRVYAVTAHGKSAASDPYGPFVPTTAPGRPIGVSVGGLSNAVQINCTQTGFTGAGVTFVPTVVSTLLTVRPTEAGVANVERTIDGGCPLYVGGLTNGKEYQFSFKLRNSVGTSAESDTSTAVSLVGPPTAPIINATSAITYIDAPPGQFFPKNGVPSSVLTYHVKLDYAAPINAGGSPITAYVATVTPESFTKTPGPTSTSVTFDTTPFTAGVTYTLSIVAVNIHGRSEAATITWTRAQPPPANEGGDSTGGGGGATSGVLSPLGVDTDDATSYIIIAVVAVVGVALVLCVVVAVILIAVVCAKKTRTKTRTKTTTGAGETKKEEHAVEMPPRATPRSATTAAAPPSSSDGGMRATVLYDYAATEENEVTLSEGSTVAVVTKVTVVGDGWWKVRVESSGAEGYAPATYLEEIAAATKEADAAGEDDGASAAPPTHDLVRSLYPYPGGDDEDLAFEANAMIEVIHRTCEAGADWWQGQLWDAATGSAVADGKVGLFPSSYVEALVVKEEKEREENGEEELMEEEQGAEGAPPPPAVEDDDMLTPLAAEASPPSPPVAAPSLPHRRPSMAKRAVPKRPHRPARPAGAGAGGKHRHVPNRPKRPGARVE